MMKSTAVAVMFAVVLGLTVGVGSSAYRYHSKPTYGFSKPSAGGLTVESSRSGRPRIEVVGSAVHDFGVMSKDETRDHTFVVKNVGDDRLELRFLEKSCQCTDVVLTRSELSPGELSEITLSWRPNNYGLDYHQVARFETNDPARLELDLTIKGKVQQIVRPVPSAVSFDRVTSQRGREVVVTLFGYRDENLQLTDVQFLNEDTSEHFTAEVSKLDAAALSNEPGAKSGVAIKLTLRPGLPIGPLFQSVRLHTNLANVEPIEIPIQGTIVGDIQVVGGRYFNQDTSLLTFGKLAGDEQHERKLWLLVKGDNSESVELRVAETDPSGVLEASFDAPSQLGQMKRYPLSIRLNPDGRMVNRLGTRQGSLGRIVIESNREGAKQLIIKVAFLLEANP